MLDVSDSIKVMIWNRRFLSCVGLWPLKVYDPLFVFCFVYLLIHCSMALLELLENIQSPEYIIANLTETVYLVMTLVKILVCRLKRKMIASVVTDIQDDFLNESYKSQNERLSFLRYNNFTYKFMKASMIMTGGTSVLYYLRSLYINFESGSRNAPFDCKLPYKSRPLIQPYDVTSYFCLCAYQSLVIHIVTFGYAGSDCFFISLILHISSQLSVLSQQIEKAFSNPIDFKREFSKFISRHHELIRLAEIIEDQLNFIFLQQLIGTTFLICLTGYHTLAVNDEGQNTKLITFFLYSMCVISTFFVYCYIGECLIVESTNLNVTLYNCKWYEVSPKNLKAMHICMIRIEKPLRITAGKFFTLSLRTFTDVLRSSLAYLSVLREFL